MEDGVSNHAATDDGARKRAAKVRGWSVALLIALTMGVIGYGCSPTDSATAGKTPPHSSTISQPARLQNGITLPVGTILTDSIESSGRKFIHFRLPAGYQLASASTTDGTATLEDEGGITCTCTQGRGCNPFRAVAPSGEVIGCSMSGSCTRCTQVLSSIARAGSGVMMRMDHQADILNVGAGVTIAFKEQLDSLPCPRDVLFRSDVFVKGVTAFLDQVQVRDRARARAATRREELPPGYQMAEINAFGRAMRVPVQMDLVSAPLGEIVESIGRPTTASTSADLTGSTTCHCLSGSGGCTFQRRRAVIGYAEWCEAGDCQSCQMST